MLRILCADPGTAGTTCPPTQGHPRVHPGPPSPTPAHAQMGLAHLHHTKHQQHTCVHALPCKGRADGSPELAHWGRGRRQGVGGPRGLVSYWNQAAVLQIQIKFLGHFYGEILATSESGAIVQNKGKKNGDLTCAFQEAITATSWTTNSIILGSPQNYFGGPHGTVFPFGMLS